MDRLRRWWHRRKVMKIKRWRDKALRLDWPEAQLNRFIRIYHGVDPAEVDDV